MNRFHFLRDQTMTHVVSIHFTEKTHKNASANRQSASDSLAASRATQFTKNTDENS